MHRKRHIRSTFFIFRQRILNCLAVRQDAYQPYRPFVNNFKYRISDAARETKIIRSNSNGAFHRLSLLIVTLLFRATTTRLTPNGSENSRIKNASTVTTSVKIQLRNPSAKDDDPECPMSRTSAAGKKRSIFQ